MNLQNQIIKYRKQNNLSQEELASEIFVTRQSISNWENGKTYPDIRSLLLMCNLFQISLDELVTGDLNQMEVMILEEDISYAKRLSIAFTIGLITIVLSIVPLVNYLGWIGISIWVGLCLFSAYIAREIDKFKRYNQIDTYKEICAFMNRESLSETEIAVEKGKWKYQRLLYMIILAILSATIVLTMAFLIF